MKIIGKLAVRLVPWCNIALFGALVALLGAGCGKGSKKKAPSKDERTMKRLTELDETFNSMEKIGSKDMAKFEERAKRMLAHCDALKGVEDIEKICRQVRVYVENRRKYLARIDRCKHIIDRMGTAGRTGAGGQVNVGSGVRLNREVFRLGLKLQRCERSAGIRHNGQAARNSTESYKRHFSRVRRKLLMKAFRETKALRAATAAYAAYFPKLKAIIDKNPNELDLVMLGILKVVKSKGYLEATAKLKNGCRFTASESAKHQQFWNAFLGWQKRIGKGSTGAGLKILTLLRAMKTAQCLRPKGG